MAGLPWFKQQVDLRRDPRSLILGDILGDPRAWTYVVEMRMYLAENAPTGCVSGMRADVALERGSGWIGERGALINALREAGFVRAGAARDGDGIEVEDVDWQREQGAHVAKFARDAKKPDGRAHKVVTPSRDIRGSRAAPSPIPSGEIRELRVESREERKDLPPPAIASAASGQGEQRRDTPAQQTLLPDPDAIADGPQEPPPSGRKRAAKPRMAPASTDADPQAQKPEPAPFKAACDMLTRVYAEVRKADYSFGLDRTRNGRAVRGLLWGAGAKAGEDHGDPLVPLEEIERRWRIGLARVFPPRVNAIWDLKAHWAACAQPETSARAQPVLDVRRGGVRAELMDHTKPQEPF